MCTVRAECGLRARRVIRDSCMCVCVCVVYVSLESRHGCAVARRAGEDVWAAAAAARQLETDN